MSGLAAHTVDGRAYFILSRPEENTGRIGDYRRVRVHLKGSSTGDFSEALAALPGKDAPDLLSTAIVRLKDGWLDEYEAWQKRDLSAKRYVCVWADASTCKARLEDEKKCILV